MKKDIPHINNFKQLIDSFLDSELPKNQEPILFNILAENNEAREYFIENSKLRQILSESIEEFPENLEKSIFEEVEQNIEKKTSFFSHLSQKKLYAFLAYGLATILIALTVLLFSERNHYIEINRLNRQKIKEQNQLINLITKYSLQEIEVNAIKNISRRTL